MWSYLNIWAYGFPHQLESCSANLLKKFLDHNVICHQLIELKDALHDSTASEYLFLNSIKIEYIKVVSSQAVN